MKNMPNEKAADPLGLVSLGDAIATAKGEADLARIDEMYQKVMRRYTALQDRYRLLKASNRQLAEEVAWLRDQCDDFALELEAEETDQSDQTELSK